MWARELAYETMPAERKNGVSLGNQANYMADAMGIAAKTNRVPLFIWYVMTDPSEAADWQSGLLTATGAAKPSSFMYRRPVSPGTSLVKKGTVLKVWSKSNVAGGATIVMSTNGSTWKTAPGQRRAADRSVTATVKVTRKTSFAVKDVAGRGPSRLVAVR